MPRPLVSRLLSLTIQVALVVWVYLASAARAQSQPPVTPPGVAPADLGVLADRTFVGIVSLNLFQAILTFFQWRISRAERDEKGELVKANVKTLAELEAARVDLRDRDKAIDELKADRAELWREAGSLRHENEYLKVRLAQATGSSEDISTIVNVPKLQPSPAGEAPR